MNESGQIVGTDPCTLRAFLYTGGQMLDLNTLVPADSGWFSRRQATSTKLVRLWAMVSIRARAARFF